MAPPRRKSSGAISRQSSFSRPKEASTRSGPKVIVGGKDVTPLPLSLPPGDEMSLNLNDLLHSLSDDYEEENSELFFHAHDDITTIINSNCPRVTSEVEEEFPSETGRGRGSQTLVSSQRTKSILTSTPCTVESACGTSRHEDKAQHYTNAGIELSIDVITEAVCSGCLLDVSDGNHSTSNDSAHVDTCNPPLTCKATSVKGRIEERSKSAMLSSEALSEQLKIMERAVNQNIYLKTQLRYVGLPVDNASSSSSAEAKLELLFAYACAESHGRPVTSLCWTTVSERVLAVGYGESNVSTCRDGRIMLWSIRNPSYPEAIYKTSAPVWSLDFSTSSLLAAGLSDGRIVVYDTSGASKPCSCIADSNFVRGRHISAVYQVKWVQATEDGGSNERLVSISIDGHKLEWTPNLSLLGEPSTTSTAETKDDIDDTCVPDKYIQHKASYPSSSTAVCAVANDEGALELWDTSQTRKELIITDAKENIKHTVLIFGASGSNILVTGSINGVVEVFKLHNL